jgi:hypothetical protein
MVGHPEHPTTSTEYDAQIKKASLEALAQSWAILKATRPASASQPAYRDYILGPDGQIKLAHELVCGSDEEAITAA